MSCIILFPHQLFENIYIDKIFSNVENKKKHIILWEHEHFFTEFSYHKMKLAFHRASMRHYYDNIKSAKLYVESIESKNNQYLSIKKYLLNNKIEQLLFFNPIEKILLESLNKKNLIPGLEIKYLMFPTPYFLNSSNFDKNNQIEESMNIVRHDIFYKNQRINYEVMVKKTNNKYVPEGNSWSFDTENRSPFEKNQKEIELLEVNKGSISKYIDEAIDYVNTNYKKNYGICEKDNFIYPITRTDSLKWLNDFIKRKLDKFGKYEDALSSKINFGYHSVLSPLTNIGLITPDDILDKIKDIKHGIASKEGFIRQVIGWREYCYFVYDKYFAELSKSYFYKKSEKNIPKKIWECDTKIPIIDNILSNVNKYAYSHHIERLMCIGNFLLLIDVHPKEIYNWFQSMYIDGYDVFMVPNVYGMLLYGMLNNKNHMMTRPYFCSSNYLMKMSDFKSEVITIDENTYKWDEIFDGLYYRLISKYSNEFSKIYSTASAVKRFNGFTTEKKNSLLKLANIYIKWIHD